MNLADLQDLYRYSDWAHERLCGAVRALPAEAGTRAFEGSFATLRDLLAHVAAAEWVWLERFRGESPARAPGWFGGEDAVDLCDRLAAIAADRRAYMSTLDDAALGRDLRFRYFSGKPGAIRLGDALFHVANHATYHRGQVAAMLRRLGGTPAPTDLVRWAIERHEAGAFES